VVIRHFYALFYPKFSSVDSHTLATLGILAGHMPRGDWSQLVLYFA
jgi:hypothetical protein